MLDPVTVSFLVSVAANMAYSGVSELLETLLPDRADDITLAAQSAIDAAAEQFFERYGDEFGGPTESFIAMQVNLTAILESTFPGSDALTVDALDPVAADGTEATAAAVEFFVDALRVELRRNRPIAGVMADQERDQRDADRHDESMGAITALTQTVALQAQELSALRASIDTRLPEPQAPALAARLKDELQEAIDALNGRDLARASQVLDTIEQTLDDYRRADPTGEGALVPIRQIVLAVRAEVASELGDHATFGRLAAALASGGPPVEDSARAIAIIAAQSEDRDWLLSTLDVLPDEDERRPWLEAVAVWLDLDEDGRYNAEGVLRVVDPTVDQADLIVLRAQAAMYDLDEDRAVEASRLLDRLADLDPDAEALVPTTPLLTAYRTFHLLQELVRTQVGGVDLSDLIVKTKRRFRAAIRHVEPLEEQYPQALVSALVGLAQCHQFLEEIPPADALAQRIRALRAKHPADLALVAVAGDEAVEPATLGALEAAGAVSPAEAAVLHGRVALGEGQARRATHRFYAALEEAKTPLEASRALDYLIVHVAPNDPGAFVEFVEQELEGGNYQAVLSPDHIASARLFGLNHRDGIDAALEVSEVLITERPKSLLLLRDRYILLRLKQGERERSDGIGLPEVLASMVDCAHTMYELLPAPTFKMYRAQALDRLGQKPFAHQLCGEAEEEFRRAQEDLAVLP